HAVVIGGPATNRPPDPYRTGNKRAFMDLILGFLAGALTLINPCVLPVLPVVLASAGSADRRGPLFLMAGMSASFVTLGLLLARLGPALGVTPEAVAAAAALVMAAF